MPIPLEEAETRSEELTAELRWMPEWHGDEILNVLQQKWKITTYRFGDAEQFEEWRDVPVAQKGTGR